MTKIVFSQWRVRIWSAALLLFVCGLILTAPTFAADQESVSMMTSEGRANVRTHIPGVALLINDDPAMVHDGRESVCLTVTEPGEGREIWPAIDIVLPKPIDLAIVQAIEIWVHVPERLAGFFFGRYDARITINGRKPLWSTPAIEPGWTRLRWDLRGLYTFPETKSLRLQLGPIMPGFDQGKIHVSGLVFDPMPPVNVDGPDALTRIVADKAAPWTARFQAIRTLAKTGGIAALSDLFVATADGAPDEGFNPTAIDMQPAYILKPPQGSEAVRSAARDALLAIARRTDPGDLPALCAAFEKAGRDADLRVRLAAVTIISQLNSASLKSWIEQQLLGTLVDDLYYAREVALSGLVARGWSKSTVAEYLAKQLSRETVSGEIIPVIRCLSELGSPAVPALPALLKILRDPAADMLTRVWCLRAVWWTDETVLAPADWALALELKPGQVHRHLLNRAMDRLSKGDVSAVVPVLEKVLASPNPEARARAASLLRDMPDGDLANAALARVRRDAKWYVRAEGGEASGPEANTSVADSPPVQVRMENQRVYFDNGSLSLVFDQNGIDPGPVEARLRGGPNLIDSAWLYRVLSFRDTKARNIIERVWFQKIRGVALDKNMECRLGTCDDTQAEFIYRYPGSDEAPLEWEFHYMLRRGDPGFYSFIVVTNVTGRELTKSTISSSADSIGMFNQLVAPTWGIFDTAVLHDHFKWPAKFTSEPDFDGYPDIYQASYRLPDGEVDAKHEGGSHELLSPVTGFCGTSGGIWQIMPSREFAGGSWSVDQKTGLNHNMFVLSLENKYYVPTTPRITAGWQKIYGPIFYYLNQGENTEEMWADAKRRAAREVAAWPHVWMPATSTQAAADFTARGTVTGRVTIPRDYGETLSPAGAQVVLALPDTNIPADIQFGQWWRDVGTYHYDTTVAEDGTFTLPHVQPGDYELFVWKPGIFGETRRTGIKVTTGATTDAGALTLEPRRRGALVWRIGRTDRSVTEFRNGGNFHQWDNYLRYRDDFPQDVTFTIGKSDPARDWNYLQPALVAGEKKPTAWTVLFDFDPLENPHRNPILTIVAGGRGVELDLLINGTKIGELRIKEIGLQHIRTVPNGELVVHEYRFDRSLLKSGQNRLELTFARTATQSEESAQWTLPLWTNYIAYDFLRLEME